MSLLTGLQENAEEIERLRQEQEADNASKKGDGMNRWIRAQASNKNADLMARVFPGKQSKQD